MSRRDGYESRSAGSYTDRERSNRTHREHQNTAYRSQNTGKRRKKSRRHRVRNSFLLLLEGLIIAGLVFLLVKFVLPFRGTFDGSLNTVAIVNAMNEGVGQNEVLEEYKTIALFGVDSREGVLMGAEMNSVTGTLSDVIMIASINLKTGDIKLCSIYRDTFMNIQKDKQGNDVYGKVNAAYSLGGPDRAIRTLNSNLDLNITDFVTIGFEGVTAVVNALGGIEVDVQEEAVGHVNSYQSTMADEMGISYTPMTHGGLQTIDGLQATAYCRVRYIAGSDLARAGHQRDVLEAIFKKAKTASVLTLTNIATEVLPLVKTSLDNTEIIDLASGISGYNLAGMGGFPQQDKITFGNIPNNPYAGSSIIANDLAANIRWLHEFLFDNPDYQLTPDCQNNSDTIYNIAKPYMQF